MVGSKTTKLIGILIVMLLAIISLSGCVNPEGQSPTPTPQPFVTINPTPTPMSTTMPAATPVPAPPIVQKKSSDIKILSYLGDNGIVNFTFVKDTDYQKESITVILRNDGSSLAKNLVLDLTETDAHGGDDLWHQDFKVGDLDRGEYKRYTMETDKHGLASSVYISVGITWGENGEYVSPVTYINTAKTIWLSDLPA